MSFHQRTSDQHKKQLTNMAYCRNKTVWYYFAVAIVLIFSVSAMAASRPRTKPGYTIRRVPEVIVGSTICEALHNAIPTLEAYDSEPFSWMAFSNKSIYVGDTTTNLVGAFGLFETIELTIKVFITE